MPTGFGRLWTAQTVSSFGDGVSHAALPLLALTLTRDPMALAVVAAAGTLPWLLFGVLGGALVDRWDRRRTMWVADAARAVLLGIPAAAAVLDVLSIPLTEPGWVKVWLTLSDSVSWPGLIAVALAAALSSLRRSISDWQEHLKVRMILREAPTGTVVATQTRRGRAVSTVVVQVGDGGAQVAFPRLPDRRAR